VHSLNDGAGAHGGYESDQQNVGSEAECTQLHESGV
jgi:hypothetical protein